MTSSQLAARTEQAGHAANVGHTGHPRHVVLVGLSGSGKTTIGRRLANRLGRPFVDTDALIETRAGTSIPRLFSERGEDAFRAVEREAVAEAASRAPSVIATGGGAPVDPQNRRLLWEGNLVVWLDAPVRALVRRVGHTGAGRPLLTGDPAARLAALRLAREPIYAQAHLRLDTGRLSAAATTETILRHLQSS